MLAFTCSVVSERYDAHKALVLDEANAIGTTYLRSEFLSDPDRTEARALLRDYVADRLALVQLIRSGEMSAA